MVRQRLERSRKQEAGTTPVTTYAQIVRETPSATLGVHTQRSFPLSRTEWMRFMIASAHLPACEPDKRAGSLIAPQREHGERCELCRATTPSAIFLRANFGSQLLIIR